jgi:hypothetical protein
VTFICCTDAGTQPVSCWFVAFGLFSESEEGGDMHLRTWLIFNGLHGVVSQKVELFITSGVITSNPTHVGYSMYRSRFDLVAVEYRSEVLPFEPSCSASIIFIDLITTSFVFRMFSKVVYFHA